MTSTARPAPAHVLLLGFGAIGRQVALQLAPEREAGTVRMWAAERDVAASRHRALPGVELVTTGADLDCLNWSDVLTRADLVVECAGVAPAGEYGPDVIAAGTDLVLTSVGALADSDIARRLLAGPGRLWVTSGAIGGFDVLGAAADAGGLDRVRIRTTKLPTSLLRPWMSPAARDALSALRPGDEPVTVFSGGPAQAIDRFPANVNVAVGLAWATRGRPAAGGTETGGTETGGAETGGSVTGGTVRGAEDAALLRRSLDRVRVELVADPAVERSRHEILAEGPAGRFELSFESAPSPENPKTSGLTALSVARTIREVLERRLR
ncbi:aspartate dehydrogenase domain-containing protein [Micrococcus sp. TA1]|uniref:aspartate dehydrogenase domain-containing protein n=1 Tax=Micrococcus sp. TA1 TaxID=681627 RepID=UPI00160B6602|nr:aspartate dehydrogenase domain-containing protein [Micrococcus sp. TA1]MBB5750550.1 aspartate dehydrogenase [Micrococcus sp. TA1]